MPDTYRDLSGLDVVSEEGSLYRPDGSTWGVLLPNAVTPITGYHGETRAMIIEPWPNDAIPDELLRYWDEARQVMNGLITTNPPIETAWNRLTISHNRRTPLHRDTLNAGGLVTAMTVQLEGEPGGETVFPERGVAFRLTPGDLLVYDLHELHGNAPLDTTKGTRTSFVLYRRL